MVTLYNNEICLTGELFPTEIRAVSAGVVNVTNHIPVVINMVTFPIITSAGLLHVAMYVYGGFALLMALWGLITIKVRNCAKTSRISPRF